MSACLRTMCVCQCVEYGICLVFGRKMPAAMDIWMCCAFILSSKEIYLFSISFEHGRVGVLGRTLTLSHNNNIIMSPLACLLAGCCVWNVYKEYDVRFCRYCCCTVCNTFWKWHNTRNQISTHQIFVRVWVVTCASSSNKPNTQRAEQEKRL